MFHYSWYRSAALLQGRQDAEIQLGKPDSQHQNPANAEPPQKKKTNPKPRLRSNGSNLLRFKRPSSKEYPLHFREIPDLMYSLKVSAQTPGYWALWLRCSKAGSRVMTACCRFRKTSTFPASWQVIAVWWTLPQDCFHQRTQYPLIQEYNLES